MTFAGIYEKAVYLIAEDPTSDQCGDLITRAHNLITVALSEILPLYRAECNDSGAVITAPESMEEIFPGSDAVASLCILKLGYILASDENRELYSVLKTEYEAQRARFIASLNGDITAITDVYA